MCLAGISPKALALGARTKTTILGSGAVALTLFSGSAAQTQCTPVGLNTPGPVVTQAAGMAVANVSASLSCQLRRPRIAIRGRASSAPKARSNEPVVRGTADAPARRLERDRLRGFR
jgi:hypothetical protein